MNVLIIYMVTIPDCSMEWPLYREQEVPSRALIPYVCVCVCVCVSHLEDRGVRIGEVGGTWIEAEGGKYTSHEL